MSAHRRKHPAAQAHPSTDDDATSQAIQHGLVTDEGVNEDRTGGEGPTLEEGEPGAHRPVGTGPRKTAAQASRKHPSESRPGPRSRRPAR